MSKEAEVMLSFIANMVAQGRNVTKTRYGYLITFGGSDGVPRDEFERAGGMTATDQFSRVLVCTGDMDLTAAEVGTITHAQVIAETSTASAILAFDDYTTKLELMRRHALKYQEDAIQSIMQTMIRHELETIKALPAPRPFSDEPWRRNGKKKGKRK